MQIRSIYYLTILSLLNLSCHKFGGAIHTVEQGETAYRIAHAYQVSLKQIKKANPRLQLNRIYPGQKVLIPGASENKEVQKFISKSIEKQSNAKPNRKPSKDQSLKSNKKRTIKGPKTNLKFTWPYHGKVTAGYGKKNGKMHNGIDVKTPPKTMIKAAEKGRVVYADSSLEGYENMLIVQHGQAVFTVYAYLGKFLVSQGAEVKKGQAIAITKNIQPSFYHFEIRKEKTALDPQKHLVLK